MVSQNIPIPAATLDALAEALHPDPFYAALTPEAEADPASWCEPLRAYFAYAMEEAYKYGVVEPAEPDHAGVAIWLLPQADGVAEQIQQTKNAALRNILSSRGFENYIAMVEAMAPHAEQVVPRNAWYLSILGIAPTLQGQGIGARLVAPTLAQADARRVPCFLETFNARTIRFYERAGFRVVSQHAENVTETNYWIMVRPR